MPSRSRAVSRLIELPLSALFLAILIPYTIVHFFGRPYMGFDLLAPNGVVSAVFFKPTNQPSPKVGDQLLQAGNLTWNKFVNSNTLLLFDGYRAGDVVPLTLLRDGKEIHIDWVAPGISRGEFLARLFSAWWLAYAFWLAGAGTLLLVRPKDRRVWLLALFNLAIPPSDLAFQLGISQIAGTPSKGCFDPVIWHWGRIGNFLPILAGHTK
ncbi:MAG: hypothetical protein P8Z00_10755 [Anaerolineales bacterium]